MGADVRLLVTLLLALAAQSAARVHTVLLTPSTPSPAWLVAEAVNFTLHGRLTARVVQSSSAAPCSPLAVGGFVHALDARAPFFLWQRPADEQEEVWFYIDGECELGHGWREGRRLARRKDLDWAQLWGIVLGIAFGLVALAAFACCSWCCCFQHRVRAHQARLHVRDEGVQTAGAQHELPLYERRVRDGEVQLEEAPAPDYHLATRAGAPASEGEVLRAPEQVEGPRAPDYHLATRSRAAERGVGVGAEHVPHASGEPTEVPLPPSPTENRHPEMPASSAEARHPPAQMTPPPPDGLPPAYSHAPP